MTLKEARKEKGYTLERLAQECGSNKSQLSHIENGTRNPSDELVKKLTAILGEFEVEKKAKFTNTEVCQTLGRIYGYLHKTFPKSSSPTELAYAVEHPQKGFLALHSKVFLNIHATSKTAKWIAEQLSNIDPADFKNIEKSASAAEQTAFLIGYYEGIKKTN